MSTIHKKYQRYFVIFIFLQTFLSAARYDIGPGQSYSRIIEIATWNLQAGDTVAVHYRAEPYFDKFLVTGTGSPATPIVILGLPSAEGLRPILDGAEAETSAAYSYWNEDRQIIKVGQYNSQLADHIIIDGFELRNANNMQYFWDDHGNYVPYAENACAIRPEYASHLTVRNCEIHSNGNGLQGGSGEPQNFVVEHCHIHDNGLAQWNSSYIHNFYFSADPGSQVTVQFCLIGELLSNGQQLKSRAETTVVRYNWIQGGRNSQLDLVENPNSTNPQDAYVYGNVIIKPEDTENYRLVHFGDEQTGSFRRGTLHFFSNTCLLESAGFGGTRRIFEISSDSVQVLADYNIFHIPNGSTFSLWSGFPNVSGSHNWIYEDIIAIDGLENTITGIDPGFSDLVNRDYHPLPDAPLVDVVTNPLFPDGYPLEFEPSFAGQPLPRLPLNNAWDLGAYEADPIPPSGDFNYDGYVNVLDIVVLVDHIVEGYPINEWQLSLADFNFDGILNILDVILLVQVILGEYTPTGLETYEGVYRSGFETSRFTPCNSAEHWWMTWSTNWEEISTQLYECFEEYGEYPPDYNIPIILEAEGFITPLGSYGHMGGYDRSFLVARIISCREFVEGECPEL